ASLTWGVVPHPPPRHHAAEAEMLEVVGLIGAHACGQDLRLPGTRRQLDALQLPDDREQAVAAVEPRSGLHVLPAEEESHQIGGAHRLDRLAQPAGGEPVGTREERAGAPLLVAPAAA